MCVCGSVTRYNEAEEDCSKAISLDDTYSKAFARRGSARAALGLLAGAREGEQDSTNCVSLEVELMICISPGVG